MMYWEFTDGSFTARDEQGFMMLDYESDHDMRSQVYFEDFDFLSIVVDHDE
jgi:hypothetical protein